MAAGAILADVVGGKSTGDTIVKTIKIVAIGIAIILIINIISSFFKKVKKTTTAVGDQMGGVLTEQQTGVSIPRQQVCKAVAQDIWDNMHSEWRPWPLSNYYWEDDEAIRIALNRLVTKGEAIYASAEFRELSGKSLKSEIAGRLNKSEEDKVNRIVLENLV